MSSNSTRSDGTIRNCATAWDHPPTRWWRLLPPSALHQDALRAMRSVAAQVEFFGEPRWRAAVDGEAASAIGIVLPMDPKGPFRQKFDVAMTAARTVRGGGRRRRQQREGLVRAIETVRRAYRLPVKIIMVAGKHRLGMLSAAYASEMLPMIDRFQPTLVVNGHTRQSIDFRGGRSRLISNLPDYPRMRFLL